MDKYDTKTPEAFVSTGEENDGQGRGESKNSFLHSNILQRLRYKLQLEPDSQQDGIHRWSNAGKQVADKLFGAYLTA